MDETEFLKELGKCESDNLHNKEAIAKVENRLNDFINDTNRHFVSVENTINRYELKMADLGHEIKDLGTAMGNKMDKLEDSLMNTVKSFMNEMAIKEEERNKKFQELKELTDKYQQEQEEEMKDTKKRWKDIKFGTISKICIDIAGILACGAIGWLLARL